MILWGGSEGALGVSPAWAALLASHGIPAPAIAHFDEPLWPSDVFAGQIMAALHSDPARHVHLDYPGAGHIVFDIPSVPTLIEQKNAGDAVLDLGGTPDGDAAAHLSDWPAAIRFIQLN